jgi:CHAD domain-containing protein
MPVLPSRYDLLRTRIQRFTRMLHGVEARDVGAVHRTRVASRRLRELLPVLQLDGSNAAKLNRHLRKVTRRLGSVREADVLLLLIDELHESGDYSGSALLRVRDAVSAARDEVHERLPGKASATALRRVARKLNKVAKKLADGDDRDARRAWRWALDARVSRRAASLKAAIREAGAVYLPDRLHAVRISLKKLRYAVELAADAAGAKTGPELRMLKRTQALLGRLHDLQVLIDRVRGLQAAPMSDPGAWRELDALVAALDQTCRGLHARYVSDRGVLVALCDRLAGRVKSSVGRVYRSDAARRAS